MLVLRCDYSSRTIDTCTHRANATLLRYARTTVPCTLFHCATCSAAWIAGSSLFPPRGQPFSTPYCPPLAASFGDLWRPLWVCLLSSLFSLLSPLFSLLSSPCRRGLATPRSQESSYPLDSISRSLFALVTSNFASGHRPRSQQPRPFAAPSLARRNARSD